VKKPSEILGNLPLIGPYIRLEKRAQERIAEAWENYKNRPTLSQRLWEKTKAAPYIGPLARFPGATREWLEDIPVAGPLAFKPAFALAGLAGDLLLVKPWKIFTRLVVAPFAVAGIASAIIYNDPDIATQNISDYLREQNIDAAIIEGVEHKNIRVYRDNFLTTAFHSAAHQVAHDYADNREQYGPLFATFAAAAMYPPAFIVSFGAASMPENAFTLPAAGDDAACFVRTIPSGINPVRMLSLLSEVPERHLKVERDSLQKWLHLMVLGHEARHCDNAKKAETAIDASREAQMELAEVRARELAILLESSDGDFEKAQAALENNAAYKTALEEASYRQRAVQRAILAGETDSDAFITEKLAQKFPGENVAETTIYARAITPFAGSMKHSNGHATASGLEAHVRQLEAPGAFDAWDAIEMGRFLIEFGRFLNVEGAPATGFDKTIENYHIAKTVVLPYLERHRDAYLPRDERHVRYTLVHDQVRLFVEGMEYLVKPESLERRKLEEVLDIPELPARRSLAPVLSQ